MKQLLAALAGKGLAPKTITGIVRTLSTILSEAVEDEKLPANPALRPGRLKRQFRDPNAPKRPTIDPYTREEAELLVATARTRYPEWAPFLLCALRIGLRLGESRALEWRSIDWRRRFLQVDRNFVEGAFTTPKNGLTRRVDLVWSKNSCGRSVVELQEAPETLAASHGPVLAHLLARKEEEGALPLVVPLAVEVFDVRAQRGS